MSYLVSVTVWGGPGSRWTAIAVNAAQAASTDGAGSRDRGWRGAGFIDRHPLPTIHEKKLQVAPHDALLV